MLYYGICFVDFRLHGAALVSGVSCSLARRAGAPTGLTRRRQLLFADPLCESTTGRMYESVAPPHGRIFTDEQTGHSSVHCKVSGALEKLVHVPANWFTHTKCHKITTSKDARCTLEAHWGRFNLTVFKETHCQQRDGGSHLISHHLQVKLPTFLVPSFKSGISNSWPGGQLWPPE